ncbi:MAG: hypothetical protein F4114_11685 [Rhodospirillaceae bacterium]|nr:hypothetical protein [Rhodospirillaceae bacterium]MYI49728.1 hypothetical protein [Rhodospirillaceae bacterium]
MNAQETKTEELIKKASSILGSFNSDEFVIFGSLAIILNGLDLRDGANDLDFFVSDDTFVKLEETFEKKFKGTNDGDIPYIELTEEIEVFKEFKGANFKNIYNRSISSKSSYGFRIAHIFDIIEWKKVQGRQKDTDHLKQIEKQFKRIFEF